jgi:SH3 domain-containing YSC84-like protein 1
MKPSGVAIMQHKKFLKAAAWLMTIATVSAAISTAEMKRLQNAATVVRDLREQSDKAIPEKVWQRAACVVIIPDLKKAAFGIGGEYGRGVMSCRAGQRWSAPVFMQLAKGSWGFQIGAAEIELVLVVMNRQGAEKLLKDKVSLGAGASVAAGPVGRAASAATDAQLSAEILSYSRARGAFAGVDISGGVLGPDKDSNTDVYGPDAAPTQIAFGNVQGPPEAQQLVSELSRQGAGASSK